MPINRLPVVPDVKLPNPLTKYKPVRRTVISPVVVLVLKILSDVVLGEE
jgi:hypothetical protein